jgi:hypothetical protein
VRKAGPATSACHGAADLAGDEAMAPAAAYQR